jgi:hypothetical protein
LHELTRIGRERFGAIREIPDTLYPLCCGSVWWCEARLKKSTETLTPTLSHPMGEGEVVGYRNSYVTTTGSIRSSQDCRADALL